MDDQGNIYKNVSDAEAQKRNLISIPVDQQEAVLKMNRRQRRAWAAQQRKLK